MIARLGNVMTYGLMNDEMCARGKILLYVWLYNGGVGCQILLRIFTHITHHRNAKDQILLTKVFEVNHQ